MSDTIDKFFWIDKSAWGTGPWTAEPDKIVWTDEATGLPCLILRNSRMGNLCGYVAVAEGHPAFDQDYDDVDVRVHGGLTYAGFCDEGDKEHGICHTSLSSLIDPNTEHDRVYWLGFDCAHLFDLSPAVLHLRPWKDDESAHYREVAYVREQCTELAAQLQAMVKK